MSIETRIRDLAINNIKKVGIPSIESFLISEKKGLELVEKYKILSLDICKQELDSYYSFFKKSIEDFRNF